MEVVVAASTSRSPALGVSPRAPPLPLRKPPPERGFSRNFSPGETSMRDGDVPRPDGTDALKKAKGRGAEDLMEAHCQGDRTAFELLYKQVAPKVTGVLYAMSRDRRLTDDLVQVTFMKIHAARDTYQPGMPVLPWAKAIARNVYIDWYRAKKNSLLRLTPEGTLPEPRPSVDTGDALDRLSDEDMQRIHDTIDAMPAIHREALLMLKTEGKSLKEISAILGISVGAVKLRCFRAYEALRRAMGVKPETDPTKPTKPRNPPP